MAEKARWKNRNRDEGRVAAADHREVIRQRHLGGVEFLMMPHAPENFFRVQGNVSQANSLRLNRAGLQCVGAIVIAARDSQRQFFHCKLSRFFYRAKTPRPQRCLYFTSSLAFFATLRENTFSLTRIPSANSVER